MSKFIRFFLLLTGIILINRGEISAQTTVSVSATGQIFAEIIPMFTASEMSQLNFGRFSPGYMGGEIILSPESTVSLLGSVNKGAGSHTAASFAVTGDIDATFSVTLPNKPVILTNSSNARTLRVDDWVSIPSHGINTGVLHNGYQVVYVGATLKVGTLNDNPVGIYLGNYTITFEFN